MQPQCTFGGGAALSVGQTNGLLCLDFGCIKCLATKGMLNLAGIIYYETGPKRNLEQASLLDSRYRARYSEGRYHRDRLHHQRRTSKPS